MKRVIVAVSILLHGCADQFDIGSEVQLQCNCNIDPQPCCCTTPIVLDLEGDGVQLTSWRDGVVFNLAPRKGPELRAWTEAGSDDAWLFLDHTMDGVATDGLELFGDETEQAKPAPGATRNGFAALAEHDADGDGAITSRDPVFSELRLWRDDDHNGVSTTDEVMSLHAVGITSLSVAYKPEMIGDGHGNAFRYSAAVEAEPGSTVGATAWDVSLASPTKAERHALSIPDPKPPLDDYGFVHRQTGKAGPGTDFANCFVKFVVAPPETSFFAPIYAHTKAKWEITSGVSCPSTSHPTTVGLAQYFLGQLRYQNSASGDRPAYNWIPVTKVCKNANPSLWVGGGVYTFSPPHASLSGSIQSESRTLDCSMYTEPSDFPRCE